MVAAAIGVSAAAGLAGSAMSAGAASDAAAGQQQAAAQANALQYQMFQENNALNAPTRQAGDAARNRLLQLLGLGSVGNTGRTSLGLSTGLTPTQLREQLVGRYTSTTPGGGGAGFTTRTPDELSPQARRLYEQALEADPARAAQMLQTPPDRAQIGTAMSGFQYGGESSGGIEMPVYGMAQNGGSSSIDEVGLQAAMDQYYREQEEQEAALRASGDYGSLTRGFEFNTYTPDTFSFSNEDFFRDPSYEWRLQQGQKALDRQGSAAGRFLSGGQLQAASDYNQGAASQEYQAAFGRAANTFNTNEGNRFGAFQANEGNRYNAYQTNFTNTVNPLLAISGAGQLATTNLMNNNNQYASTVGSNLMGAANASGAAGIAGANAYSNALSNGGNSLLTSQLLNRTGSVNNNPFATPYPTGANYAADNAGYQG